MGQLLSTRAAKTADVPIRNKHDVQVHCLFGEGDDLRFMSQVTLYDYYSFMKQYNPDEPPVHAQTANIMRIITLFNTRYVFNSDFLPLIHPSDKDVFREYYRMFKHDRVHILYPLPTRKS